MIRVGINGFGRIGRMVIRAGIDNPDIQFVAVNDDWAQQFDDGEQQKQYLEGLSTHAKFLRFSRDFRKEEGDQIKSERVTKSGVSYIKLRMQDALEFLTKKDYTDNWDSEMHERFCSKNVNDWTSNLEERGFTVHKNSHAYMNPWIRDKRIKDKVEIYREDAEHLVKVDYNDQRYFITTMLLIADKPMA